MTLSAIQKKLKELGVDAYIVTYGNRFIGQDILQCEHKLKHLCGFSGSAGMLAITEKQAFLFVDGRYELQARQEVDLDKVTVINEEPSFVNVCRFLQKSGAEAVGYDGMAVSVAEKKAAEELFENLNLIDAGDLTGLDCKKTVKVLERPLKYAGKSSEEKLEAIAKLLNERGAGYYLLTAADSVSWLLNIYAEDLARSPVVRAYALIDKNGKAILIGNNLQTDLPVWTF
ncbi:MAG TPA: hypothetical protein DD619_01615, partial [Alphaproteobacteria bacterium]|nr:hypothetical protein [Alphaproteobacteria bacterium]